MEPEVTDYLRKCCIFPESGLIFPHLSVRNLGTHNFTELRMFRSINLQGTPVKVKNSQEAFPNNFVDRLDSCYANYVIVSHAIRACCLIG